MQYTDLSWQDRQPYSERFDDIYYSSELQGSASGIGEFHHVFFEHNHLANRWREESGSKNKNFVVAELGLGSTLNCLLTIREWLNHTESNSDKTLHYIAIERYPLSPDAIRTLLSDYNELEPYTEELLNSYPPAVETTHICHLFDNRVVIHYKFMDVMDALDTTQLNVDAWFLDGFSPTKNPAMWSQLMFENLAANSHAGTTCSTYTAAGFVKRNLQSVGFSVEKVKGYGRKREMLRARMTAEVNHFDKGYCYKDKPWFKPAKKLTYKKKKATIIGAGITGLSLAYALVTRGWNVTVIDKNEGVDERMSDDVFESASDCASDNLASIIYPRLSVNNDADTEFYIAAYSCALNFINALQKENPDEKFWHETGLLQRIDKNRLNNILNNYQFNENFAQLVEGEFNAFKNINKKTYVNFKRAGVVIPKILRAVLINSCSKPSNKKSIGNEDVASGRFKIVQTGVNKVSKKDNNWQCYSGSTCLNESEVLILASGYQLNNLGLAIEFPVESVRGQMLELDTCSAGSTSNQTGTLKQTINEDVYITAKINKYYYLGGTYSRNSESLKVSDEDTVSLLDSADLIYPQLFSKKCCKQAWVGIRSMSKDRTAIVGAIPDIESFENEYSDINLGNAQKRYKAAKHQDGLYVSAAHGSRGFTHSFLCAEILSAQINNEPMPVSDRVLEYLNPSRFIVNNLKRR